MTSETAYFYDADGTRVPLRATDELAVQWDAAAGAGVPGDVLAGLEEGAHELRGGVSLVARSAVPEEAVETLDQAGALHPVYTSEDGARVVVLPEVRVELDDDRQAKKLHDYLASSDVQSEIVRESGGQIVLRPSSNRGVDALELANHIGESLKPPMSQARFLRVVPRPR